MHQARQHSAPLRYLAAILVVAIAAVARWMLTPVLGEQVPFLTFFPAVIVATLLGGLGPGLLALALSTTVSALWMTGRLWPTPPSGPASKPHDAVLLGAFLLTGGLLVGVCQAARTAWDRAARSAAAADATAREFRAIFEQSSAGAAQADPATTRFTRVNRRFCEITGYTEAELLAMSIADVTHPDDRDADAELFRRVLAGAEPGWEIENRCRTKDGQTRWVHVSGTLLRDDRGRPVRTLAIITDVTDRRREQAALADSEARLREADDRLPLAMRFAHVGTWTFDLRTGAVSASESTDAMFGVAKPPGEPRTLDDYLPAVHPDDRPRFLSELRSAADSGLGLSMEYRLVRPGESGGGVRWIASRGDAERDETGAPARMAGAVFDITDRKLAEIALADREHSYRELFESTTDAIFVGDERGRYVDLNPAAAAMLGSTVEALLGRDSRDFVLPEHLPLAAEVGAALRRDGAWSGEFPMVRADGTRILVEYRSRYENGRVVGFARDVTERRRAEEAAARLAAIVESTDDAVIGKSLDGLITSWNRGAQRLLGFAPEEVIGRPTTLIIPPELAREEASILDRLRRGERVEPFETVRLHKDGTPIDVSVTSSPVRDASGRIVGAATIAHDLRARKRAEDLLRVSNDRLEQAVAERTRELEASHQRLRHSERMAALGTLAAGIGHDLANLLLPIRVRLDALEAGSGGAGAGDDAQSIRKSLDYLAQLAQGLRLLARDPEAPTGPGDAVDLTEWWATVGALMRNPLPRSVDLRADIPVGLPRVAVATPALTQSVFNLVQNAGDALRDRSAGRVTVSARAAGPGAVELTVTDDGPGMPPEVLRRCFEPYFSTKPRGISTGLGLSFVQGLIDRAGGSVRVESEPGRGAAFTLTLPAAPDRSAGGRRRAALSVRDPRTASVLRSFLPTVGFEPAPADGVAPADALVWITDDARPQTDLHAFLAGDPAREVVLVARDPRAAANGPRVVVLPHPINLGALRDHLRALAGRA